MKTESLDKLSDDDIITRRAELMRELMAHRIQLRMQQLEDNSKIKKTRRALARMNTELRKREIAQGLPKSALLGRTTVRPQDVSDSGEGVQTGRRSRFGLGFLKDALLGKRSE